MGVTPFIEEKLTVQEEVNRSHSHGISKLASGKDWVVADSPAGSKKRYIGEFSTTVNEGFKVTIWVTPNYIIGVRVMIFSDHGR